MRTISLAAVTLIAIMFCATAPAADTPEAKPAQPAGKSFKILLIGNSFSQNATEYLPKLVESQGNTIVLGHAEIGGCSLEKHWELAQKFEANPADKEGKPYYGVKKSSLREMLESDKWDIVTLQQHSWKSCDIKTYQPFAGRLADYIRKYAPQAKIWIHETWAYREDDTGLLKKITQEQMYIGLRDAYAATAKEINADKIIPTGTAFQNIRQDPRWHLEVPASVDPNAYKYPDVPVQKHSLNRGWAWSEKDGKRELTYDPKHCTAAGKYLAALVWYETLYGDLTQPAFAPPGLPEADAALMREFAHKTVKEGLKPKLSDAKAQK